MKGTAIIMLRGDTTPIQFIVLSMMLPPLHSDGKIMENHDPYATLSTTEKLYLQVRLEWIC